MGRRSRDCNSVVHTRSAGQPAATVGGGTGRVCHVLPFSAPLSAPRFPFARCSCRSLYLCPLVCPPF